MIAVDTNLLILASRHESGLGDAAHAVMTGLAEGFRTWANQWPCRYEFLSVVTNRRIWRAEHHQSADTWRTVIRLLQDMPPAAFGRSLP